MRCFIVAGGPSLSNLDFCLLTDQNVITVNNAFLKVPNAHVVYFTDQPWFEQWKQQLYAHQGKKIRGHLPKEELNVSWVDEWLFTKEYGLATEPRTLAHGFNSGFAAINLAVQLGYDEILLLGYDMGWTGGKANFHSDHQRVTQPETYKTFLASFDTIVEPLKTERVSVVNLTQNSALKVFPAADVSDYVGVDLVHVFSQKPAVLESLSL